MKLNWKHPLILIAAAAALVWAAGKYAGPKVAKIFASPVALGVGAFLVIGTLWKGGMFASAKDVAAVTK